MKCISSGGESCGSALRALVNHVSCSVHAQGDLCLNWTERKEQKLPDPLNVILKEVHLTFC